MVLNLAELESDCRWKWFLRPRQVTGMSVADYYNRFRIWMDEMINLSFPAKDEDYIDGFIENLSWDIQLRVVSKCRLWISSLSDAFYNAKWEESLIRIEGNLKEIRATRVFDEIPSPTPIECEKVVIAESVEEDEEVRQLAAHMEVPLLSNPEATSNSTIAGSQSSSINEAGMEFEEGDGSVFRKLVVQNGACKVFDRMPESILEADLLGMEGAEVAHYMFDETPKLFSAISAGKIYEKSSSLPKIAGLEIGHHVFDGMPELTSARQNRRIDVHGVVVLPIGALSYVNEAIEVSSFHVSSKSKFEEVDTKNYELGVDLWIDGTMVFIFDPGGYSLLHMGCNFFEFNRKQGSDCSAPVVHVDGTNFLESYFAATSPFTCPNILYLPQTQNFENVLYLPQNFEINSWIRNACDYTGDGSSVVNSLERFRWYPSNHIRLVKDLAADETCARRLSMAFKQYYLYFASLSRALIYWHGKHILHWDIKPRNLLFCSPDYFVCSIQLIDRTVPFACYSDSYSVLTPLSIQMAKYQQHLLQIFTMELVQLIFSKEDEFKCFASRKAIQDGNIKLNGGPIMTMTFKFLNFLVVVAYQIGSEKRFWEFYVRICCRYSMGIALFGRNLNFICIHWVTFGTILESFMWDPGKCAISVYILEDKDVLKRKGIGIRLAWKQDEGLNGASTCYYTHMEFLARSLFDRDSLVLNMSCFFMMIRRHLKAMVTHLSLATGWRGTHLSFPYTLSMSYKLGQCALIIYCAVEIVDPSIIVAVENSVWDPGLVGVLFDSPP